MKTRFSFRVLRYVHDPVTQEFVNIGIAVYAPERGFLKAKCATLYARIRRMFILCVRRARAKIWSIAKLKFRRRRIA